MHVCSFPLHERVKCPSYLAHLLHCTMSLPCGPVTAAALSTDYSMNYDLQVDITHKTAMSVSAQLYVGLLHQSLELLLLLLGNYTITD